MSTNSSSPQVNGVMAPQSAFIQHILGYPVIHYGVDTFKSNPYGQKSLQIGDSAYKRIESITKPVMQYVMKPYQYFQPYVKKVDDIGDKTLSRVDKTFPVVMKPTDELYDDAKSIVLFPIRLGQTSKDHVLSTYNAECKKVGGDGIVTIGKAAVSTAVIITFETVNSVTDYLSTRKNQVKMSIDEKINN